jgi:hypothetical protein
MTFRPLVFALILSVIGPGLALASQPTIPSNLQVVGTIAGSGSVQPAQNDIVQIVRPASTGTIEAQGTVLSNDGTFFVDVSKPQAFNGTALTAVLRKSNGIYQLNDGASPLAFNYSGTFPFPSRISFALTIGNRIGGSAGGGSGGGSGGGDGGIKNDTYDVSGDGVFNQGDIDLIRQALSGRNPASKADVNKDGLINTRDVIDATKALRQAQRPGAPKNSTTTIRQQSSGSSTPTTGTTNP